MDVNSTQEVIPRSGYDLNIYGLKDGSFYTLHLIAISCLGASLVCDIVTLSFSFKFNSFKDFFKRWRKGDRFVVYLAMFDGIYCFVHLADHVNVFMVKDHVYPQELCVFYAFVVLVMLTCQNLLVNVIAVNAFALMYCGKNLNFGKNDGRLLAFIVGVPVFMSTVVAVLGKLGPTGAFCAIDGVTGKSLYFALISVPQIVILLSNIVLYVLTWYKLRVQSKTIQKSVGKVSPGVIATHNAAQSMVLFVVAYIVRWWALAMSGFWGMAYSAMPQVIIQLTVSFSNIGGILNMLVFIMIRRQRARSDQRQGHVA